MNGYCFYCGVWPAEHNDHAWPGGDLLVGACATCNCTKGQACPPAWALILARHDTEDNRARLLAIAEAWPDELRAAAKYLESLADMADPSMARALCERGDRRPLKLSRDEWIESLVTGKAKR